MVPFESFSTVFYSHLIATMTVSLAVSTTAPVLPADSVTLISTLLLTYLQETG